MVIRKDESADDNGDDSSGLVSSQHEPHTHSRTGVLTDRNTLSTVHLSVFNTNMNLHSYLPPTKNKTFSCLFFFSSFLSLSLSLPLSPKNLTLTDQHPEQNPRWHHSLASSLVRLHSLSRSLFLARAPPLLESTGPPTAKSREQRAPARSRENFRRVRELPLSRFRRHGPTNVVCLGLSGKRSARFGKLYLLCAGRIACLYCRPFCKSPFRASRGRYGTCVFIFPIATLINIQSSPAGKSRTSSCN